MKELTLEDHARAWYAEKGQSLPNVQTHAGRLMYEAWVNWAFSDFKGGS